ncbi:MAG: hypothetical protein GF390_02170 [Candidatus Pacebacteria bacterium]|nr:hypothetical protein [Candidatus Paceibacterota bacterium]
MIEPTTLTNLKELINQSQTILVIFGTKAKMDQLMSATSLFLGLKQIGKDVSLLAPQQPNPSNPVLAQQLKQAAGLNELKTELGKQNLVVSFDYSKTAVDNVSYHISEQTNKFYLTIKPQKGHSPLDSSKVEFSYAGAQADLIFLVGEYQLEELDQLYYGYEGLYEDTAMVTVHSFEPEIGNIKLDVSHQTSMSEAMVEVLEGMGIGLDADMATNLLMGIENVTQSFKSRITTAATFEVAAKLMRMGARRVKTQASSVTTVQPQGKIKASKSQVKELKPGQEIKQLKQQQVVKDRGKQNPQQLQKKPQQASRRQKQSQQKSSSAKKKQHRSNGMRR